jgi:hypothetical protein
MAQRTPLGSWKQKGAAQADLPAAVAALTFRLSFINRSLLSLYTVPTLVL